MRVDWQWSCVDTLNASVITASLNATLSNQGFCEGDKNEQPFSQEDVEYGIFLEPYNNKKRVQNEWLIKSLSKYKSKIGQRYTASIYPAFSIQSISLNNAKIQNSRKIQYSRKICDDHFFYYIGSTVVSTHYRNDLS